MAKLFNCAWRQEVVHRSDLAHLACFDDAKLFDRARKWKKVNCVKRISNAISDERTQSEVLTTEMSESADC